MHFTDGELRNLGQTGLRVSPIAFGGVKLGRNTDVKYPDSFSLPDDQSIADLLSTAANLGINLIDTAPAYGASEARIGALLPGKREDWIISSKVGEFYQHNVSSYDYSREAIGQSVARSLRDLRTDYLDLLLLHSDGNDLEILSNTDALECIHRLKEKGDVRAIGISAKTLAGADLALQSCDVIMVTLNCDDTSHLPVIARAHELGIGVLLKKVLGSGHIPPEKSLQFALSQAGVHSAVIGTLNSEHLKDNVRIAKGI